MSRASWSDPTAESWLPCSVLLRADRVRGRIVPATLLHQQHPVLEGFLEGRAKNVRLELGRANRVTRFIEPSIEAALRRRDLPRDDRDLRHSHPDARRRVESRAVGDDERGF